MRQPAKVKKGRPKQVGSKILTVCAVFALGIVMQSPLLGQRKPRIAVLPLENPGDQPRSTIGRSLSHIIETEIGRTGKIQLVERESLEQLEKEIKLGQSAGAKGSTFAKAGNLKGAEYVLKGRVEVFSYQEKRSGQYGANRGGYGVDAVYEQIGKVRIGIHVIKVETGEMVLTDFGEAQKTNVSRASEQGVWFRCLQGDFSAISEFQDSLIGRATMDAVRNVARKVSDLSAVLGPVDGPGDDELTLIATVTGKIVAQMAPGEYFIDLGSASKLQVGDVFDVRWERTIKNSAGKVVGKKAVLRAARLKIRSIETNNAEAVLLPGATVPASELPREGDLVSLDVETARTIRQPVSRKPGNTGISNSARSDVTELVRQGDRYFEDEHYAQALEQYRKAGEARPDDMAIIQKLADTYIRLKDLLQAEVSLETLIERGNGAAIPVAHIHFAAYCVGYLGLERSKLSYVCPKGSHGFESNATEIKEIALDPPSAVAPPYFRVVQLDAKRKEKKYDFLPVYFARPRSIVGGTIPMSSEDQSDTLKIIRMLLRLSSKYITAR